MPVTAIYDTGLIARLDRPVGTTVTAIGQAAVEPVTVGNLVINGTLTPAKLALATPLSVNGAIPVTTPAVYAITKAGVLADTVAAPTVDGIEITVTSDTANAHTLTFTGNTLDTGSAAVLTATFAAFKGAGLTFVSYNSRWKVLSQIGITFS